MAKQTAPLQRLNLQLPKADVDFIRQLGYGTLSAGVRRALALARRSPYLDLGDDTDLDSVSGPSIDSDVVGDPTPKAPKPARAKPKPPTTSAAVPGPAPDPAATATPKPATNILDLPLPFPKPIVYDDDDGVMDLDGMTSEEIERELAQNRADAERAERKQEAYKAAANGQGALIAPKGADDGDDDYDPYSQENLPEHLR